MTSELPLMLRRQKVIEVLGITKHEIRKMIDGGLLKPIHSGKNTRAWFRRDDLLKIMGEDR